MKRATRYKYLYVSGDALRLLPFSGSHKRSSTLQKKRRSRPMLSSVVSVLLWLAVWLPHGAEAQTAYRLAGSYVSGEGRLEVFYGGTWGTVCDDYFNNIAANIACKSLGYVAGGEFTFNQWGPGYGQIWLDDVNCNGDEQSVADCLHLPWGQHNCVHQEDVSIRCYSNTSESNQTETVGPLYDNSQGANNNWLRLAGSSNPGEGRLEVNHNGVWGTVCDDFFSNTAAWIACFNLGFSNGGEFVNNRCGPGDGPIWLDDVNCDGREASLFDCPHLPWGSHNCAHGEDVSIRCYTFQSNSSAQNNTSNFNPVNASTTSPINTSTQGYNPVYAEGVRLVNPNSSSYYPTAGRLEVLYNGTWGTVCDDGFSDAGARVVCARLGHGRTGSFISNTYGAGTGPIWLDNVFCNGNETDVASCIHNSWGVHDCSHNEDVSISCTSTSNQTTVNTSTTSPINTSTRGYNPVYAEGVRLVTPNSSSYYPTAGRLEVLYNGTWGTVCDDGFSDAGARVVCARLGHGRTGSFISNTYGAGTGPIWLDDVFCNGYETDIASCNHNSWGVHDCSHNEDVSISCTSTSNQTTGMRTYSGISTADQSY